MTAIVGVICRDGIVIGSDSAATFGSGNYSTIEQPTKKCKVIKNELIMCGTGEVGLDQRVEDILETQWDKIRKEGNSATQICTNLSALFINNFRQTNITSPKYGNVIGFLFKQEFHLCEFAVHTMQPEMKKDLWWVSMGSGQMITDPFLGFVRSVFWENNQPNLEDGIHGTVWALQHAIKLNPGGIGGKVQIATLSRNHQNQPLTKLFSDEDLAEHIEFVDQFEQEIMHLKGRLSSASVPIPNPPDT